MSDSYWMKTTPDADCPALTGSHETDIVVIGGGLTGLHAALKILEDDPSKHVTLIEADRICSDASGRTMGKLAVSHSRIYPRLSDEAGKTYLQANQEGFDRVMELIETYKIDCDLQRTTNYIFATTEAHVGHVRKDYEAMKRIGLDVEWIEPDSINPDEIPLDFLVCLKHPDQAEFHSRKFALGLLRAILDRGAQVYEHTRSADVIKDDEGVTVLIKNGATIRAKKAVVATRIELCTNEPYHDALSYWRSHMSAFHLDECLIKNVYTRYDPVVTSFRSNGTDLVLGGSDGGVQSSDDEGHYRAIQAWADQAYFAKSPQKPQVLSWSGEDTDSADRLPLIGTYRKNAKHVFVATGYCGWGMTKSAFAGVMLADLVVGRPTPYQRHYDPWRFSAPSI